MAKAPQEDKIPLSYSLFDLPTAQHKAGLAGLLLLIESMRQRGLGPVPIIEEQTATGAKVTVTKESLQALFDDLYDAEFRETESKTKWSKKEPKREESFQTTDPKTGKTKKSKVFIYDTVVPKVSFLEHSYPGGEEGWLKLWRDMIWQILRGIPTTRGVYQERAEGKPSGKVQTAWKDLLQLSQSKIADFQSSLFIGAQDSNAERVPFKGRVGYNLLLHFWPLVVQVFVPEAIDREGKRELKGFVLAIPEVGDLEEFCEIFPQSIATLDPQIQGYRPKASIINLPVEGGLEFLRHLTLLSQQKATGREEKYSVSAVELFHLEKRGNNIKLLSTNKLISKANLLSQYEGIRGFFRNPLLKSQLLLNLLRDADWLEGFPHLFSVYPWEFFIRCDKTPNTFPYFSSDVRRKFEVLNEELQRQQEAHAMAESTAPKPQSLEKRIYEMIGSYVRLKTESKSGMKWAEFKDKKTNDGKIAIPPAYLEARTKMCADTFLAMRSRREQEFVEYFTGTICSVPQFLPQDDYIFVSQVLLEEDGWEKIKTLSMLALSAHS